MGTEEHLNWDQHALNEDRVRGLTTDKPFREMLSRVGQGSTPVMGHKTQSGHIQLRIKGDGVVHMASTPSDHRAVKNMESLVRRKMAEIGHDFPKKTGGKGKGKKKEEQKPLKPLLELKLKHQGLDQFSNYFETNKEILNWMVAKVRLWYS
jgi:hypothetical protein